MTITVYFLTQHLIWQIVISDKLIRISGKEKCGKKIIFYIESVLLIPTRA